MSSSVHVEVDTPIATVRLAGPVLRASLPPDNWSTTNTGSFLVEVITISFSIWLLAVGVHPFGF